MNKPEIMRHSMELMVMEAHIQELREALLLALEEIVEHGREYHHVTPPALIADIKAVLERTT